MISIGGNAEVILKFMKFYQFHPYFSTIKSSKRILRHSQVQLFNHVVVASTI